MRILNTIFNEKSNVLCNNYVYQRLIIDDMHNTMIRLYQAARDLTGLEGQSAVADKLGQSPQTLNNWESRGMSKGGMLIAQRVLGVSAVWLEAGTGEMVATTTSEPDEYRELIAAWESLLPRERLEILREINAKAEHNREVRAEAIKQTPKAGAIKRPATAVMGGPPSAKRVPKTIFRRKTE